MKVSGWIAVAALAAGGVAVAAGFYLPSTWHARASTHVRAAPDAIFRDVGDLRAWPDWTPWNRDMDPTLVREFRGPDHGVGAEMRWRGDEIGEGRLVITALDPPHRLEYRLHFDGAPNPSHGRITVEPEGDGSRVTWTDRGDVGPNPVGHLFVGTIASMLARDFSAGLSKLARRAEARAAD